EQAVGMDDEVAHACVVDGALRGAFPSVVLGPVIWIGADEVDLAEILEHGAVKRGQFAADDEVEELAISHDEFGLRPGSVNRAKWRCARLAKGGAVRQTPPRRGRAARRGSATAVHPKGS